MTAIVALLGVVAVWCPPNNYDSLTYHLTRIEHWVVNKSVAHYPIHVLRQLSLNPGAEYLILQARLLSGGDYFSNSLQWFSMLGCLMGTSLIAKQLGAEAQGQVLSAVTCLTIPIGLLESTTTQNDYVASFWLVCVFSFCLSWFIERGTSTKHDLVQALWIGLALGLGLLTKPTIYFFALMPMILLAVTLLRRLKAKGLIPILIIGSIASAFSAPFMVRNIETFGTPVVSRSVYEAGYLANNASFAPQFLLSNNLRTIADELQSPIPIWNKLLFGGIKFIHKIMHCDSNDPRSTYDDVSFEPVHPGFMLQEDIAGNPLHTILFFVASAMIIASKKIPKRRLLLYYGATIIVGYVLFNCVLKWQPWHSRLLLPLYVIGSSLVGFVLSQKSSRLSAALTAALLVCSIPYLIGNPNKLLVGNENIFATSREENYFRSVPNYYLPYAKMRDVFEKHDVSDVGVAANDTSWAEYPLWTLLNFRFQKQIRIDALSLTEWAKYNGPAPDAMISYDRKPPETISLPNRTYQKALICDSTNDRFYYHFFGKEVGKTYGHLSMALYLPEPTALTGGSKESEQ